MLCFVPGNSPTEINKQEPSLSFLLKEKTVKEKNRSSNSIRQKMKEIAKKIKL